MAFWTASIASVRMVLMQSLSIVGDVAARRLFAAVGEDAICLYRLAVPLASSGVTRENVAEPCLVAEGMRLSKWFDCAISGSNPSEDEGRLPESAERHPLLC